MPRRRSSVRTRRPDRRPKHFRRRRRPSPGDVLGPDTWREAEKHSCLQRGQAHEEGIKEQQSSMAARTFSWKRIHRRHRGNRGKLELNEYERSWSKAGRGSSRSYITGFL